MTRTYLRWAGGKQRLASRLVGRVPDHLGTYREPFAGAASLFFSYGPSAAVLSDSNAALIRTHEAVRDSVDDVCKHLEQYRSIEPTAALYYRLRDSLNSDSLDSDAAFAGTFIYLNATGFNGIWRVNRDGRYNVPFGRRERLTLPTEAALRAASKALAASRLESWDFETAMQEVQEGDFVYLDPPYLAPDGVESFDRFTASRFSADQHELVATWAVKAMNRGADVMISNADLPLVRELYSDFFFSPLEVFRSVSANGDRYRAEEVVITSFPQRLH